MSVNLMPDGSVARVVELAVLAEQHGYASCWVYDEGLVTRDVYVTLTAIAARTDTIPLGPGITNPYVRHPGATATAIATLDEFSGGRAFMGLGTGGGLTLGPMAIDRDRPLTAVRDMVTSLRSLFAGERTNLDGSVFSFDSAMLGYGRPDIEIIMAGRGPKIVALGGQVADGFILSHVHKDLLGAHTATLRAAAGDRPFCISYSTMVASTDAEFEAARAALTFRLVDSPPEVKERIGMTDADSAAIRAALGEGGTHAAAVHVKDDWVRQFVISGSPRDCARELTELMALNDIDQFQLPVQQLDGAGELIERTAAMF